ncbi:acyltransferase domain-containing protein, partial [Streptomyces johnsoniae]|uniref:acyltransferase domain-containing protein n=1 Tax=Streptomyces johnsoniae TaxID=3075532 RepID=UPI00288AE4D8
MPFYSTVVGGVWDTAGLDADYWVRNLRETVRFGPVVEGLLGEGFGAFVEVSAHPVLTVGVEESGAGLVVGSLRRGEGGAARYLASLAEGYAGGLPVDWSVLFPAGVGVVDLPAYAFQRRRYWLVSQRDGAVGAGGVVDEVEARFWAAVENEDPGALADTLQIDDERLREVLPALSTWRRRHREQSHADSYR